VFYDVDIHVEEIIKKLRRSAKLSSNFRTVVRLISKNVQEKSAVKYEGMVRMRSSELLASNEEH
jgi:hypothetical protein